MILSTDFKLNSIIILLVIVLICSIITIIKCYTKSSSERYSSSYCPSCSMFHSITKSCSNLPYELKEACLNDKDAMDELYTALGASLKLTKPQIDEKFNSGKIGWREILDAVNSFPGKFNVLGKKMATYKNYKGENSMRNYCDFAFMSDTTKKGPLACVDIA